MNKAELIDLIASGADIPKLAAEQVMNAVLFHIMNLVTVNQVVKIAGLGSFSQVLRSARVGRNPLTGELIQIEASISVKFKPGIAFKNALNPHN